MDYVWSNSAIRGDRMGSGRVIGRMMPRSGKTTQMLLSRLDLTPAMMVSFTWRSVMSRSTFGTFMRAVLSRNVKSVNGLVWTMKMKSTKKTKKKKRKAKRKKKVRRTNDHVKMPHLTFSFIYWFSVYVLFFLFFNSTSLNTAVELVPCDWMFIVS
eukprot:PhF_6_TR2203/c0_g1_i1/m.3664